MQISDVTSPPLSDVTVVDLHSDYAIQLHREIQEGKHDALATQHLPMLQKGQVSVEVNTVGGDFSIGGSELWDYALVKQICDAVLSSVAVAPELFHLLLSAEDIRYERNNPSLQNGSVGFMLALEGVRCLEESTERLHELYASGLRSVILTHNNRNAAADGCNVIGARGLSAFGHSLIEEMRSLRMMLDLVHLSVRSFWDAISRWNGTVTVSHSNARTLCRNVRNLDDDQIKAVGECGGVIGLNFLSMFVDDDPERADLDRLADHAVHIASITGPEALGLGPDFADYFTASMLEWQRRNNLPSDHLSFVQGAKDVRGIPAFLETLYRRGFSIEEIKGIAGLNALRVYERCLAQ